MNEDRRPFFIEKIIMDNKSKWDAMERMMDKWTFIGSFTFILCFNIAYWFTALM